MTSAQLRTLWNIGKWLFIVILLAAVGRVFYQVLNDPELQKQPITWDFRWLIFSCVIYLIGLSVSGWFWHGMLCALGGRPRWYHSLRAYHIGHLGKYVPGKALAILIRATLIRAHGIHFFVAAASVVYETLISMTGAATVAVVLMAVQFRTEENRLWQVLLLIPLAVLPTLPWVFNPAIRFGLARFRRQEYEPIPPLKFTTFGWGLILQSISWLFLGTSLWAIVMAMQPQPFSWELLFSCTAALCVATVIGFFTPAPGGIGVREYLIMILLADHVGGQPFAVLAALVLRLCWVLSEVIISAVLYPLRFSGTSEPEA